MTWSSRPPGTDRCTGPGKKATTAVAELGRHLLIAFGKTGPPPARPALMLSPGRRLSRRCVSNVVYI